MSRPICQAQRNDGEPCRGPALPDSGFCWAHDESRAEEMAAARSRGATKANKLRALAGRRPTLTNGRALTRFASDVVQDVLSGKVAPDIGRVVLYGCATLRQLVETSDLEQRLAALEAQLPTNGTQRRSGGQW